MPNRFIGDPLQRVMFAAFSRAQGEGEWPKRTLDSVNELIFLAFVPVTVIIAVTSREVIDIVLGPGWEMSAVFVTILVLAIPLHNVNGVASAAIRANGAVYTATVLRFLTLAYLAGACYIAAHFGVQQVAGAVAVGALVYFGLSNFVLKNMDLAAYGDAAKRVVAAYIAIAVLIGTGIALRPQFAADRLGDVLFVVTCVVLSGVLTVGAAVYLRERVAGVKYAYLLATNVLKRVGGET
jgi:O-antigen/teichoic acid export membrane protein